MTLRRPHTPHIRGASLETLPHANPRWTSGAAGLDRRRHPGSRAPALHEGEASEHGLRCIYKLIDLERLGLGVDALGELVTAAERMGFAGLNITHPCKQAVMPLLTELSSDAAAIGAVNTVLLRDGKRIGHNTDWWGFAESFRRGLPDVALDRLCRSARAVQAPRSHSPPQNLASGT